MSNVDSSLEVTEEFVDVTEYTRNVQTTEVTPGKFEVTGDGVFDVIMTTVTQHLNAQLDSKRIKGEMYAGLYAQLLQAVLQTSTNLILQKAIADKQEELVDAQIKTEEAKEALYRRQAKGFDDDAKQKMVKILFDVWGIAFSVAKDNENLIIPESINKKVLDSLVKEYVSFSDLGSEPDGGMFLDPNPYEGDF